MKARPFYPSKFNIIIENDSKGHSLQQNQIKLEQSQEKKAHDSHQKENTNTTN